MSRFHTVEMHTGGEPVRIIASGFPAIGGATILDKRRGAMDEHDRWRRVLMHEPRGHADMYGVIPVEPDHPDADLAVLFVHNDGFSTMCGHATIAIGRWAVDSGLVEKVEPTTHIRLQVPAGLLELEVDVQDGRTGRVTFLSVPAFVTTLDAMIDVGLAEPIRVDVAYGGAFYAFAEAAAFGLDVRASATHDLVDAAWMVTEATRSAVSLEHPDSADLAFLYGTILTDGADAWSDEPTANVCVFADREVDRSPTGSGVTARIALQRTRGQIEMGTERSFMSITGAIFTGRAVRETTVGTRTAWVVEVGGMAHYTGKSEFWVEPGDELEAFLLR